MPVVPFFNEARQRASFKLPEIKTLNLFSEQTDAPTSEALLSRPSLKRRFQVASAPCRGLFQTAGAFGSDVFSVFGNQLYRRLTKVTGAGGSVSQVSNDFRPARFACSSDQLVVTSGGKAYCYSNVAGSLALRRVSDPDLPAVRDVVYLGGRFFYFEDDSDRIWFSDLGDATSIGGLSFQTAEASPDPTIGAVALGQEIIAFGVSTTQVFALSGSADAPLTPADGRSFDKGAASQAAIVKHDNTVYFLGSDRLFYRLGGVPERISTPGIEELLRKSGESLVVVDGQTVPALFQATASSILYDGHAWILLNIPQHGSFAYDSQTQKWVEWDSYGAGRFRADYAITTSASNSGEVWLGDFATPSDSDHAGWLYKLDSDTYIDNHDPITRWATAAYPVQGGRQRCDIVMLQCVRGVGNSAEDYPVVEMRYSDDQGQTWSKWDAEPLGRDGQYWNKAIWRRLGLMQSPGRAFQFRSSDPVIVAFEGVSINEVRP